jgi:hypothetical protein
MAFLLGGVRDIMHRMIAEPHMPLPRGWVYVVPSDRRYVMMFGPSLAILSALVIIAVMSIYFPSVYIRKTNVMIHLLEQIAANTKK